MICESCGCSDNQPCFDYWGDACTWIAPGQCSDCAVEDVCSGERFELPPARPHAPHYRQHLIPRQVA
jgi:hypothetical protein